MGAIGASGADVVLVSSDGPPSAGALCDAVRGADALICHLNDVVDAAVLRAGSPTLRVVANVAVGVDNVDVAAAVSLGITVCNTPGVLDAATADLAIALLLCVARRVVDGVDLIRDDAWGGFSFAGFLGRDLEGMTLGVVGFGRIGRAVASRAMAFQMAVLHHQRHPTGRPGYVADLDELLASCDAVSLHVPLSDATRGMLDARRLALMPRGAIIVNTARGPVVDEAALVDALWSGQLGGAGIDVYDDEPMVSRRLRDAPHVVLTPHIGTATIETRTKMCHLAVSNVIAVLAGGTPPSPVAAPGTHRGDAQ